MDAPEKRLLPPKALAAIGLSVFVMGAIGLSFVHLGASVEQIEQTAAEHNIALGRTMTQVLAPDIERLLTRTRNADPDRLDSDNEIARLRQSIGELASAQVALHANIFKLAIIAPSGHTVFATGDTSFGADKSADEGFRLAMTGQAGPNVTFREQFENAENEQTDRDVVLNYLPFTATVSADQPVPTVLGVYEIQADVTAQKYHVRQTLLLELGIMLATFIVIIGLLLAMAQRCNSQLIDNRRQQKRLALGMQRAEEESSAKTAFLADVSHQLRTPLNAIIGFSEILKDGTFGPLGSRQYQSYAEDIHHSGRHLLAIISDLLDLTKIQLGQNDLQEKALSLGACLETTTRMMSCQPEATALEFHYNLDPNLPRLFADESAIQHIVQDLLSNAIKYTMDGAITVTTGMRRDGSLEFSIADTGVGIPDDELAQINRRFDQIEVSWRRKFEGSGLGLALVKALMVQHEGVVSVTSEIGVGTTVTCHFPRLRTVYPPQKPSYAA